MTTSATTGVTRSYRIGHYDGITVVTCAGWDGLIEIVPRQRVAVHLAGRPGAVGAYILVGEDAADATYYAYVGSGCVAARLATHLRTDEKGPWTHAVIITAPSGWFTRDRAAHVEATLIRDVRSLGQVRLLNLVAPTPPTLDGDVEERVMADWRAMVDLGLRQAELGLLVRRQPRSISHALCTCTTGEQTFVLASGYPAFLVVRGDALYVRAGSLGRAEAGERWAADRGTCYDRRQELVACGDLRPLPGSPYLVVSRDIRVVSPSEGSCILTAQETSGQTAWRHVGTGKTYAECCAERPVA